MKNVDYRVDVCPVTNGWVVRITTRKKTLFRKWKKVNVEFVATSDYGYTFSNPKYVTTLCVFDTVVAAIERANKLRTEYDIIGGLIEE